MPCHTMNIWQDQKGFHPREGLAILAPGAEEWKISCIGRISTHEDPYYELNIINIYNGEKVDKHCFGSKEPGQEYRQIVDLY